MPDTRRDQFNHVQQLIQQNNYDAAAEYISFKGVFVDMNRDEQSHFFENEPEKYNEFLMGKYLSHYLGFFTIINEFMQHPPLGGKTLNRQCPECGKPEFLMTKETDTILSQCICIARKMKCDRCSNHFIRNDISVINKYVVVCKTCNGELEK